MCSDDDQRNFSPPRTCSWSWAPWSTCSRGRPCWWCFTGAGVTLLSLETEFIFLKPLSFIFFNLSELFEFELVETKLAFWKLENLLVILALPRHFLLSSVMVGLGQDIGWVAGVSASIRRLDCWQGEDSSCSSGNCVWAEVMVIRGRVGIFLGILSQNRGRNNTHCGRVRFCNGPRWTKEAKAEAWQWMIYISC